MLSGSSRYTSRWASQAENAVRFPSAALVARSLSKLAGQISQVSGAAPVAARHWLLNVATLSGRGPASLHRSVPVTPCTLQRTSKATRTVGTDLAASYDPVQALVALLGSKVPPSPGKNHSTSSYAGGPPLQLPRSNATTVNVACVASDRGAFGFETEGDCPCPIACGAPQFDHEIEITSSPVHYLLRH